LVLEAETTFLAHMAIIQAHFGYQKALGKHGRFARPLLNLILIDKQFFFKVDIAKQLSSRYAPSS